MPRERSQEIGREFVSKVCSLLDRRFGIRVFQVSYQADDAVSIPVRNERIAFDILLFQTRVDPTSDSQEKRVYFYCECKKREHARALKRLLKEFLHKSLRATTELKKQYSDDFGFIFICNKPFGIDQTDLEDVAKVTQLLNDSTISQNDIADLCGRIGILFFSYWFLNTTAMGRLS